MNPGQHPSPMLLDPSRGSKLLGPLSSFWASVRHLLLEGMFPRSCFFCGAGRPTAFPHICQECALTIPFISSAFCLQCGAGFYGIVELGRICGNCLERCPAFRHGRSLFNMQGKIRACIHALKYKGDFYLLHDFAQMACQVPGIIPFLADAVLVPVPMHKRKLRKRGFNQSERIAQALRKVVPGVKIQVLLTRIQDSPSQTSLSREARLKNVKRAFELKRQHAPLDPHRRYILVDDVFTTGATLNACAQTLYRHGARQVDVFTLGHA